jgi:hypothetical protein
MNFKKDLFKIFQESKDQYNLYEKIIDYVEKVEYETRGKENANFYDLTSQLHTSINNAGCEERRSKQIEFIWGIQHDIEAKYENFLP